mmetsp:Transcript_10120/g.22764  ORF Transcript_10120/g.22764 Transcript_10120/m.22764 type:complete len:363 (+) Transcript_10120:98-1186(+)
MAPKKETASKEAPEGGEGEEVKSEKVVIPFNDAEKTMSDMGRTLTGKSYAYRSMDCAGKGIGALKGIEAYEHLHLLDLSQNHIKDVTPLKGLQNLLTLKLANNEIPHMRPWLDPEAPSFPQLLHLDLSNNSLTLLPVLPFPMLRTVSFANNEISKKDEEYTGHATLQSFDLSDNKLKNLEMFAGFPALTKLDLSGNELTTIDGLADVPELQELILARNKFQVVEGETWATLTNLHSLDLAGNKLRLLGTLEALRVLPKLRSLNTSGNPIGRPLSGPSETTAAADDGEPMSPTVTAGAPSPAERRTHILLCHWRLDVIDDKPVSADEREAAKQANLDRMLQEREAQKRAEEEAAAAAAAENGD